MLQRLIIQRFLFVILFIGSQALPAFADIEIPVSIQQDSRGKVLFLLDDSDSMLSIVEHPAFDRSDLALKALGWEFPSVIYRLKSGSADPTRFQTLEPALIEVQRGYHSAGTSRDVFKPFRLKEMHKSSDLFEKDRVLFCYEGTRGNWDDRDDCPDPPGPDSAIEVHRDDEDGENRVAVLALSRNPNVLGRQVFQTKHLDKHGGETVTDSDGNEYLSVNYRHLSEAEKTVPYNRGSWGRIADITNRQFWSRLYNYAGGKLVINGVEVDLVAGSYSVEYLKWIFYLATPEQRATLPNKTRIMALKDVLRETILQHQNIDFGIMGLMGMEEIDSKAPYSWLNFPSKTNPFGKRYIRNGAMRLLAPIGTDRTKLLDVVDKLRIGTGGTSLFEGYIAALQYMAGESHTSPITSGCDQPTIVFLTDGTPYNDDPARVFGQHMKDWDGDGDEPAQDSGQCENIGQGRGRSCLEWVDDAAYYAHNLADFSPTISGKQTVRTFMMSFGVEYDQLDDIAAAGGTGKSYDIFNEEQLRAAMADIVAKVVVSPVAGSGASLAENFGEAGWVFRPRFSADRWTGNIDVYEYDEAADTLDFRYDVAEVLENRDTSVYSDGPRTIFAGFDPDNDGRTAQMVEFTEAQAKVLRPKLFRLFDDGTYSPDLLEDPLKNYTDDKTAATLIRFLRGEKVVGLRIRDREEDGGLADLGDIVSSNVLEIPPMSGNYTELDGYIEFVRSQRRQPRVALFGANDGMLHAFEVTSGKEVWAYIPSTLLPHLELLSRLTYNIDLRRSYVDGPVAIRDAYVRGRWRKLAMFGLRTGGSTYTVLDVTDRLKPKLLFEVGDVDISGQSWSKPEVVYLPSRQWYMVVGTGEGKPTKGTQVVGYRIVEGSIPTPEVLPVNPNDPAGTRTSNVIAVDSDTNDPWHERLYVGTETGDLYRFGRPLSPRFTGFKGSRMFQGDPDNPIVSEPVAALADNPAAQRYDVYKHAIGIYFGTGRYDSLADARLVGATPQRVIGLFDPLDISVLSEGVDDIDQVLDNVTLSDLQNQSPGSYTVVRGDDGIYRIPPDKSGFYIELDDKISLDGGAFLRPAGMTISPPINFRGALFASTFLPTSTGECGGGGHAFLMGLNFRTGGGFVVDNTNPREGRFYNGGIPDLDKDGKVTPAELASGLKSNAVEVTLDMHVSSVDLSSRTPYLHDGLMQEEDVWLDAATGGIRPAVSSLGNLGPAFNPSIFEGGSKIVIQPSFIGDPQLGSPSTGNSGGSPTIPTPSGADLPSPPLIDVNLYRLPVTMMSFFEAQSAPDKRQ